MRRASAGVATELAGIGALAVLAFVLSWRFDLAGRWDAWGHRQGSMIAGDVLVAAVAVVAGLLVFAWRRYREVLADARELEATKRRLAATDASYRSLFDYHPYAVFSLDREGRYVAANAASAQLGGYSVEELQAMTFAEIVLPEELERAWEAFSAALAGTAQQLQLRIRHKAGHVVDVEMVGLPIVLEAATGEVSGVYGIAQDVTERNRLHRALADALAEANQASSAKSRFLATVSHEIRTPLAGVLGANEVLLDLDPAPDQERLLRMVERSGRHLLHLVNELLDFSSLEAGSLELHTTMLDPREVVADALATSMTAAADKGLRLVSDVADDLPPQICGDATRLRQVLTNLVSNAVKFTDTGMVRVSAERVADQLVLRVEDTGIGIPEEQHLEIFEPFTQADSSITRQYGGTGLGLAIAHRLVESMNGAIHLDSVPGVGSRFSVYLPLEPAPAP